MSVGFILQFPGQKGNPSIYDLRVAAPPAVTIYAMEYEESINSLSHRFTQMKDRLSKTSAEFCGFRALCVPDFVVMKMPLRWLKTSILGILIIALLPGCIRSGIKNVGLPPIFDTDLILVQIHGTPQNGIDTITNKEQIAKITAFVNALPQHWSVPWYGPPVGQVYFNFYRDGVMVGNFYVGPNFFCRDANYGNGHIEFYSQSATKDQIEEVGRIADLDLWKYSQAP